MLFQIFKLNFSFGDMFKMYYYSNKF